MIRHKQIQAIRQQIFSPMAKTVSRPPLNHASSQQLRKVSIERNLSQRNYDPDPLQFSGLGGEVPCAVSNLNRRRLITRRRTSHHGRNPRVPQLQPVLTRDRIAMVRQTNLMQHRIHKVPRTIAREGPTRPVRAMRSGSQSYNQNSRLRITESRHRLRPISLVKIGAALLLTNRPAISPESLAALARDNRRPDALCLLIQKDQPSCLCRLLPSHCHELSSYRVWPARNLGFQLPRV